MTRNTHISLARKYFMVPGHQLHHVYKRAHLTLLSTSVSPRLNGDLLPLKSHIQWRKRSGYPLPLSRAASLLAPPPPPILLTCHLLAVKRGGSRPAHLPRPTSTAGSKLWISPPENQDRQSARQSAPRLSSTRPSSPRGNASDRQPQATTPSSTSLTTNSLTYCLTSTRERAQAWASSDATYMSGYATRQRSTCDGNQLSRSSRNTRNWTLLRATWS